LFTQHQHQQLARGRITAGLTPARMGPWGNRPRGPTPLQQFFDKRAADTEQRRQGAL
jgi:hypothetical protein